MQQLITSLNPSKQTLTLNLFHRTKKQIHWCCHAVPYDHDKIEQLMYIMDYLLSCLIVIQLFLVYAINEEKFVSWQH